MAELLAPAGNPEALDAAIGEGADAVYLGLKSFNARLRSSNFAWSQYEAAVDAVHKRGKKLLVTVNTVLQESETERMYRFLAYLAKTGPDGIIVQDFGVLNMARAHFPSLRVHASTQMNIASARAANTMGRAGVSRVVLARELGLSEIKDIRARTSCELEVFVHGALCVSESGLCLFSSFLGGKSANRGMCAQACRRLYSAGTGKTGKSGYFFSPLDLQLIDRIPDLVTAGVNSFKIEGRMKSAEYVGTVVSAYRHVLDNWEADRKSAVETARRILANDFARAKTRYWYDSSSAEGVLNPDQAGGTGIALGHIERVRGEPGSLMATLAGGTYDPDEGDSLRFHRRDDSLRESHKVSSVSVEGNQRWISIPDGFGPKDPVYLIQTKAMSKRYPRVIPNDLSSYRGQPGADKIPSLRQTVPSPVGAKGAHASKGHAHDPDFPEGVYVQVDSIDDLYMILTDRPVRVIVELNGRTTPALLGLEEPSPGKQGKGSRGPLPFSKRETIVWLDPFLPQADEDALSTTLDDLVENGYTQFVVNNPGHIGMLRNRGLKLVAGPYLYTFNRWALDWLTQQSLSWFVTPLENSRDNLEATVDPGFRSQLFVTVFSYPALFRMRFALPESYDFTHFHDRQGGVFRALSGPDGSSVVSELPFSIVEKSQVLGKAQIKRHIVDISRANMRKQDYRAVMDAYRKGAPLAEFSKFNWKDGFYDPDRIEEIRGMNERATERANEAKSVKAARAKASRGTPSQGTTSRGKPSRGRSASEWKKPADGGRAPARGGSPSAGEGPLSRKGAPAQKGGPARKGRPR